MNKPRPCNACSPTRTRTRTPTRTPTLPSILLTLTLTLVACTFASCQQIGDPPTAYPDPTAGYDAGTTTIPDTTATDTAIDPATDKTPPTLVVSEPTSNAVVDAPLVAVKGTAGDDLGVAMVQARVNGGDWLQSDGGGDFVLTLALKPGPNKLDVRVTDVAGKSRTSQIAVYRRRAVELTAHGLDELGGPLKLTLSKAQLKALIPADKAADLVLYYLDIRPLLLEALAAIKAPQAYGVDTSSWGPAEWNMQKIITMQPDNTDLTGTSFEKLAEVSGALGVATPLMLAEIAQIQPTDTYLTTQQVADALFRTVLSSHPALVPDPADGIKKVPISLADALNDLADLHTKLGPSGNHPGVLYDATPSAVLMADFEMTIAGKSNLRPFEGVDLSAGKAWLLSKKAGADVVTFDFLDPKSFTVKGVANEPQVDLFFRIREHKGYVKAGNSPTANPVDGFAKGNCAAWNLPPWTFEHMVIDLVYHAYRKLHFATGFKKVLSYDVGTLKDAAKASWNKGWLTITTIAGLGSPPPPGFWWDMVAELAQVRLHDGGLKEGEANLRLAVTGVTVPVTAEEIIDRSRKLFEEQKSKLAAASIGDHSSYDSECDLFLVRLKDGGLALFYVTPDDIPAAAKKHAKPGLFADATLTNKLSTTAAGSTGDGVHEKLALFPDQELTLYAADVDGSVWQLQVLQTSDKRARVRLAPAGKP